MFWLTDLTVQNLNNDQKVVQPKPNSGPQSQNGKWLKLQKSRLHRKVIKLSKNNVERSWHCESVNYLIPIKWTSLFFIPRRKLSAYFGVYIVWGSSLYPVCEGSDLDLDYLSVLNISQSNDKWDDFKAA